MEQGLAVYISVGRVQVELVTWGAFYTRSIFLSLFLVPKGPWFLGAHQYTNTISLPLWQSSTCFADTLLCPSAPWVNFLLESVSLAPILTLDLKSWSLDEGPNT